MAEKTWDELSDQQKLEWLHERLCEALRVINNHLNRTDGLDRQINWLE